jgi:hypothetical protein
LALDLALNPVFRFALNPVFRFASHFRLGVDAVNTADENAQSAGPLEPGKRIIV